MWRDDTSIRTLQMRKGRLENYFYHQKQELEHRSFQMYRQSLNYIAPLSLTNEKKDTNYICILFSQLLLRVWWPHAHECVWVRGWDKTIWTGNNGYNFRGKELWVIFIFILTFFLCFFLLHVSYNEHVLFFCLVKKQHRKLWLNPLKVQIMLL